MRKACFSGVVLVVVLSMSLAATACNGRRTTSPLISAKTTMVTAWRVPLDPMADKTLGSSPLAKEIRWGYQLFTDTPHNAPRFVGGKVSCSNCHLNAGQRERSLPLVGIAGAFPEYNGRAARLISLPDRVVDCFMRSENAAARSERVSQGSEEGFEQATASSPASAGEGGNSRSGDLPTPTSKEVLALSAYITWMSKGSTVGTNPPWRGQNTIPAAHLIPVAKLDVKRGAAIFTERCTSCHGADGQGVQIGDKKAGPLWGPDSWNDGAGAARVYTLAGIVRYSMPYLDPGSLTDEEAQNVAAFITSQPRPVYPLKDRDYVGGKVPVDAVYYRARAGTSR